MAEDFSGVFCFRITILERLLVVLFFILLTHALVLLSLDSFLFDSFTNFFLNIKGFLLIILSEEEELSADFLGLLKVLVEMFEGSVVVCSSGNGVKGSKPNIEEYSNIEGENFGLIFSCLASTMQETTKTKMTWNI